VFRLCDKHTYVALYPSIVVIFPFKGNVFHSRILTPCSTKNLIWPILVGSECTKDALKEALRHKYETLVLIANTHFNPSTTSLNFTEVPFTELDSILRTKCITEIHATIQYSIVCLVLSQL
jgi:hypothetical protein